MGTVFSDTDLRGYLGEADSTEYFWNAGKAFSDWLEEDGSVVIVHSSAIDPVLFHAFTEGILLQGRSVIVAGEGGENELVAILQSSPTIGGVTLSSDTGSKLFCATLYSREGFKITSEGGLGEVRTLIESANFTPAATKGVISSHTPQAPPEA